MIHDSPLESVKKVTPKLKKGKRGKKIEKEPEAAPVSQMSHRYGSYSIAPTPSASATLKTEQPLLKVTQKVAPKFGVQTFIFLKHHF